MLATLLAPALLAGAVPARAAGGWTWPVSGPVIRGFDPPADPYGTGHRGIDIAVPSGTAVVAAAPGTVTFAGSVGGALFVTVAHAGGLESTYSWLSSLGVSRGDAVAAGDPIGLSGEGHPGSLEPPHLHLGVRLDGAYVDPLAFLAVLSVAGWIRLAPLAGP